MSNTETQPKLLRALTVRYLGATNYKGSRVVITDEREIIPARRYLDYGIGSSAANSAADIAEEWLIARGWRIVARAEMRDGSLLLTDDFRREEW